MTKWTKADIDGLVANMDVLGAGHEGKSVCLNWEGCTSYIPVHDMRQALYVAAGLTAEGEAKPETRIVWIATSKYAHSIQRPVVWDREPTIAERLNMPTTTFTRYTVIPDGAA